jgi:hypothetical protein
MNHPQQPREYDAVLGGNSLSPEGAAVLGGIEGVKLRLKNPDSTVRIAALEQALNYGEEGLDLVIAGLKDESWDVEYAAYSLLKSQTEARAEQAVVNFNANLRQYTKLRDLLAEQNWAEADNETAQLMLSVGNRSRSGWLDTESIDNFRCEDLRILDQLWVKYSNGRFGFSVQKRIYQSLGGTRNYDERIWNAFKEKVGWRKEGKNLSYSNINFNILAVKGHLPGVYGVLNIGGDRFGSRIFDRDLCNF